MGLDMFAEVTAEKPSSPVDFEVSDARQIFEWWKHPNLHGWMERLYRAKGGKAEMFNRGAPVVLTSEDLDRLEADIRADSLPFTSGFFFGYSIERTEEDLSFIAKAREAIAQGLTVYYDSSW
ncbi:phosphoglycerate kinase [Thiocapsa imhoffii]|uniref:Phosphoglycerate kinase n=1 Tax=Thiocapsa imhoffii TaxID=382777 RepID=A0A9X0WJW9_9GAMM|nr:hypothetical protein [Thiocapsa imhoffii]MBK1645881.1 phosphoglycerate kinase [Thiocapsa imhoffii]